MARFFLRFYVAIHLIIMVVNVVSNIISGEYVQLLSHENLLLFIIACGALSITDALEDLK